MNEVFPPGTLVTVKRGFRADLLDHPEDKIGKYRFVPGRQLIILGECRPGRCFIGAPNLMFEKVLTSYGPFWVQQSKLDVVQEVTWKPVVQSVAVIDDDEDQ